MHSRKNVLRCFDISIMRRATTATSPFSYSQTCSTFRTAGGDFPPARTSLGCVTFVDFFKNNPCVSAFIFQHCFDHSPACIQNGLSHFGFAKPRELTSPTKIAAFSLTSWRLYLCKSSFYDCGFWRGSLSLVVVCSPVERCLMAALACDIADQWHRRHCYPLRPLYSQGRYRHWLYLSFDMYILALKYQRPRASSLNEAVLNWYWLRP